MTENKLEIKSRKIYDCDTYNYWCSAEDYEKQTKKYGYFTPDGTTYKITTKYTPRPWLNYLCNKKIASVISNTGLGFYWYKTSLLRITKYEHEIDYQPREFKDGREIVVTDKKTGNTWNVFRDAEEVTCDHHPGYSTIVAVYQNIEVKMSVFVPTEDACECWIIEIKNLGNETMDLSIAAEQMWSIARFGIHTAKDGIPYLSEPGKDQSIEMNGNSICLHSYNKQLPVNIWSTFMSPQATNVEAISNSENRKGKKFVFIQGILKFDLKLETQEKNTICVLSGADDTEESVRLLQAKYNKTEVFDKELNQVKQMWNQIIQQPFCKISDINIQNFLNIWLKNQLFLTFRYIRSGYIGYRDTLQDSWGYELLDPDDAKRQIMLALSYMKKDGTCPRNFSPFGKEDGQDLRNCMDSATWLGMTVTGYIKETGDFSILNEKASYLDDEIEETVEEHIWRAFNTLYEKRGRYGFCLVCDGDWNDAIEGISKKGKAVSVWLTIALYHAQNLLADMYKYLEKQEKEKILRQRSKVLKKQVNTYGWDGNWYIYAFTDDGIPVGSHTNKEGFIHLNVNTWAMLSGLADKGKVKKILCSIDQYLNTDIGPALLYPPYREEGNLVGRIAGLEPGTFENGSVYQHAVTFYILACLRQGFTERAVAAFAHVLPTYEGNFDSRRTGEPYCTGNYYCGPSHQRFGQNFFSWFTGNAAWLLRIGFDQMLGVRADYDSLVIEPRVPAGWKEFYCQKRFRGVMYHIYFKRGDKVSINTEVKDIEIMGNRIRYEGEEKEVNLYVVVE